MLLITNAHLVTWEKPNRILADHAVAIDGTHIVAVGAQTELLARFPSAERLDGGSQLVMPGNICAHTHFYGAFSRGLAISGAAPQNFVEILHKLWWRLDRALDAEGIYYSALVCLVDAIRHGTTTLIDHHASPNVIDGSLDIIARAVDETGLRAALCYEVTDRNGQAEALAGIHENLRFLERVRHEKPAEGRIRAHFGLHAGLTLSEETLGACRADAPQDAGFHLHLAEGTADQEDSLQKTGLRLVDRLDRHGILGPRSIAAHGVHLDNDEITHLAQTGAWLSHQPRSNMNNAVGTAPVEAMQRAGVRVCLGNDGFSNAMWEEWKAAYLVQKMAHGDPQRMPGGAVTEMAIYQNAALASQVFGEPLGVIAPGAMADLIFVDYHPFTPLNAENLPWHILFGFHESMVTATMVAGRLLMYQRRLLILDEEAVTRRALETAENTWKRFAKIGSF